MITTVSNVILNASHASAQQSTNASVVRMTLQTPLIMKEEQFALQFVEMEFTEQLPNLLLIINVMTETIMD